MAKTTSQTIADASFINLDWLAALWSAVAGIFLEAHVFEIETAENEVANVRFGQISISS